MSPQLQGHESPGHGESRDSAAPAETWKRIRVKYVAETNPSKSAISHLDGETEVSFLPMEAIGERGGLDMSRSRPLSEVKSGYTYMEDGDVILAKITPCFENGKGAVVGGALNGVAFATTEVIPLRCREESDPPFIYYLLTSDPFKGKAEASMYGAGGQKRVADSFVANYSFELPSVAERIGIARFLDYETARIDGLIEKQEQLIALLQEKRQAVISHAVTKGLNPDAPMRDSGIEWLGEVPVHWEVQRLKHRLTTMEQGWSPQCHQQPAAEGEWGVLKVGCVNGGVFKEQENKALPEELNPKRQYTISQGDLLISRANTKDLVGSAAIVDHDCDHLLLCDKLYRLRFQDTVAPSLVSLYLGLPLVRQRIELEASGASHSMQNISQSTIRELHVLFPPKDEALRIVQDVMCDLAKLDAIIQRCGEQVNVLQERRSALISAAVTGKIDVRGWTPPEGATAEEDS